MRFLTTLFSMWVGGLVSYLAFILVIQIMNKVHVFQGTNPTPVWDENLMYLIMFLVVAPIWLFVFLPLQLVISRTSRLRSPHFAPLFGLGWLFLLPFSLLFGMAYLSIAAWILAACLSTSIAWATQSLLDRLTIANNPIHPD